MANMDITEVRIKLYVNDYESRCKFYETLLKLRIHKKWDRPIGRRGVMYVLGPAIIELLEGEDHQKMITQVDLSLAVPNVWDLWKQIGTNVSVIFPLRDNSWGDTSFCIEDPGGFRITFFTVTND